MARAFLREDDRYVALLDDLERTVLRGLMEQTRILLSPEVEPTGDAFDDLVASMGLSLKAADASDASDASGADAGEEEDGRDPALDRLLPTAHRGDDAVAAEFRRLTEEGLRQRKSGNLDLALRRIEAAADDRVELAPEEAPPFLVALTDVRLLLGERMGMRTEEDAEALYDALESLDGDDPLGYAMAWYDFLTWLQETLTQALMGGRLDALGIDVDTDDDIDDDIDDDSP
ncbi:DUF2017 domain-containing protein [Intrasporangium sp. YIM S08009]|uniref:DUF2017 domain-containing protein n=1 Tax=Intrasporangium zincisolvens TaxID=3080018 RepID=UPI002B05D482|nr:DUF2017 domain-containing protein [Intrasporangium sp. YIM S08009]